MTTEERDMTREEKNAKKISTLFGYDHRFTLSDTGEDASPVGYNCHVINYDKATMTSAEFLKLYPWFDLELSVLDNLEKKQETKNDNL